MRNDVSVPPDDFEGPTDVPVVSETPPAKAVSKTPIPPPDDLKADVQLYDHPDLAPRGAGNFRLLAMIGIALIIAVAVVLWLIWGLMK